MLLTRNIPSDSLAQGTPGAHVANRPKLNQCLKSSCGHLHNLTVVASNPMSALGQKQTFTRLQPMSALPPKADMDQHRGDVRFVPKADIGTLTDVRFTAQSGVALVAK